MILVVGATGLLGTRICERLRAERQPVRALVRRTSNSDKVNALRSLGCELVTGDLKDPPQIQAVRAAQSQALGSQPALAELCRLYWSPLWMFTCVRALLREEVGRNVSDQEETDEEIHALCEVLVASEERSDP